MSNEMKQVKSYVLHLEPEFDKQLQKEYVTYFKENNIPSKNKQGAVFNLCRSLPAYNKNDMGIRPEILELSYKTIENTLGDLNHNRNLVIGSTMKSELIRQGENEPIIMRICAVFSKDRLRDNPYYSIDSISEQNGFSMEALFQDWEYMINGTILTRQEKPEITEQQVENLVLYGEAIYDQQGNRVILLLGTIDNPIEFNGFAVIVENERPADPQSDRTFLEVASEKQKQDNEIIKEVEDKPMSFKIFETEAEYNTWLASAVASAVATAKQEVETNLTNTVIAQLKTDNEKLKGDLQTAQASYQTSLGEKDVTITDLTGKLQTAEASVVTEKDRADKAEGELQKQAIAKQVEDRKQILAKANYECDEDDLKMLATASTVEFDTFVKRIERAQASVKKAVASQLNLDPNFTLNLTLDQDNQQESQSNEKPKLIAF